MKVSLIGSNGFLANKIGAYCNKNDVELAVYGFEPPLNHDCQSFVKTDLLEGGVEIAQLIESDIIIYAAGAGIQSNQKERFDTIYELNVSIPVKMADSLNRNRYGGVFITFGSVFEIGESSEKRLFKEEDVVSSIFPAPNDYTITKRLLTRFIASYRPTFRHWHFFIPSMYGKGEQAHRLIPYTVHAIKSHDVPHFTSGDQVRHYLHVNEIPELIFKACDAGMASGFYNIPGHDILSVRQVVAKIYELSGCNLPTGVFGVDVRADAGMKYLALDGAKLYDAIGFSPRISIEEGIKEYLNSVEK